MWIILDFSLPAGYKPIDWFYTAVKHEWNIPATAAVAAASRVAPTDVRCKWHIKVLGPWHITFTQFHRTLTDRHTGELMNITRGRARVDLARLDSRWPHRTPNPTPAWPCRMSEIIKRLMVRAVQNYGRNRVRGGKWWLKAQKIASDSCEYLLPR